MNIPNSVQVEKGELFSLSAVDVYDIDGSIESLQWLYQGRLLSHETELSYSFDSLGVYRIELVAIDNSSEQISQDIYIEVLPASVSKYYWLAVFFIFFSVVVFVIIPGLGKKIARK
ncbi:MAG: hypothetical protein U9Q15_02530 [Patescibacteria group bacterium]|nr:hypothetical protein [Patescibacteria group bacterium]